MAQATGKLMWGQAGEYDAIDDRQVISAGLQGAPGVLVPPQLAAAGGLAVTLDRFAAAVACDDGTLAVAFSSDQITLTAAAGPGSGSRTDAIWLEADPDAGTWDLDLVDATTLTGRLGIALGSITVPQGANLATQFTMWPTINQMGWLRSFPLNADRRQFYGQSHPWGPGWGNLASVTNDPTYGYHVDVTDPRGSTFEMLWCEKFPRQIQSGFTSVLTGPFGGINNQTFPFPFSQPPAVIAIPTTYRPGHIAIVEANMTPGGWQGTFYDLASSAPAANAYVHFYWVAVGRITTDTLT